MRKGEKTYEIRFDQVQSCLTQKDIEPTFLFAPYGLLLLFMIYEIQ